MISVDKHTRIEVSAAAFLWPAVLLMVLPLQWVAAMVLAAAVHEFSHIAAISLTGGKIYQVKVGIRGAVVETGEMLPWKELLCALAGPVCSACLLLLVRWLPRTAICGAVHCLYNLLPLFPLDGGRVLRSLIMILFRPDIGACIWKYTQLFLRICILALCSLLALKYGWLILLLGIMLLIGTCEEKLLANRPFWRYNRETKTKGYAYDRIEAKDSPWRSETRALYRRRIR